MNNPQSGFTGAEGSVEDILRMSGRDNEASSMVPRRGKAKASTTLQACGRLARGGASNQTGTLAQLHIHLYMYLLALVSNEQERKQCMRNNAW